MAVLRSQRKVSATEFENTFMRLYRFSSERTSSLPKRRRKWLSPNIDLNMNRIYRNIMEINECYFKDKDEKEKYISDLSAKSVELLMGLEKPLMVLWDIQCYETKKMVNWVSQINKEISLLTDINAYDTERGENRLMILDWRTISSVEFLKNMSNLHRYIHGKVVNANACYDDTEGALIIGLVDDAFYSVMKANVKIPTTKEEYDIRSKHISNSISFLKQLNRKTLTYFNLMHYSERVMNEWSEMLVKEINLLIGLQRSDKKRFAALK